MKIIIDEKTSCKNNQKISQPPKQSLAEAQNGRDEIMLLCGGFYTRKSKPIFKMFQSSTGPEPGPAPVWQLVQVLHKWAEEDIQEDIRVPCVSAKNRKYAVAF